MTIPAERNKSLRETGFSELGVECETANRMTGAKLFPVRVAVAVRMMQREKLDTGLSATRTGRAVVSERFAPDTITVLPGALLTDAGLCLPRSVEAGAFVVRGVLLRSHPGTPVSRVPPGALRVKFALFPPGTCFILAERAATYWHGIPLAFYCNMQ
jgi:hypothetical protein